MSVEGQEVPQLSWETVFLTLGKGERVKRFVEGLSSHSIRVLTWDPSFEVRIWGFEFKSSRISSFVHINF